jgi:hypothetical protein
MFLKGLLLYVAASRSTNASRNPSAASDPEKGSETVVSDDLDRTPGLANGRNGEVLDGAPYDRNGAVYPTNPTIPRRFRRLSSATVLTSFSNPLTLVKPPSWLHKFKVFIFPPKEDINSFIPNYRITPIISGIVIPFSILLELPGVTEHWYIRTEYNKTIESRPNTEILNVGLGVSVACAVIANICLIMRFMEKRVKTMTILCTTFLTIHGTHSYISQTGFVNRGRVLFLGW